jgi:hypothetical protein
MNFPKYKQLNPNHNIYIYYGICNTLSISDHQLQKNATVLPRGRYFRRKAQTGPKNLMGPGKSVAEFLPDSSKQKGRKGAELF